MSSTLESEDLENVQLVRMEDVQPSRDRPCEDVDDGQPSQVFEDCIVDDLDYDNECVVDCVDDDSNIGSMEFLKEELTESQSEGNNASSQLIVDCADDDSNIGSMEFLKEEVIETDVQGYNATSELIVPKILNSRKVEGVDLKPNTPAKWPTLEILPGGVINPSKQCDYNLASSISEEDEEERFWSNGMMMYACAKCSQPFKQIFSLVQHVRSHEVEKKKSEPIPVLKHNHIKYLLPNKAKVVLKKAVKKRIVKVPKKTKS